MISKLCVPCLYDQNHRGGLGTKRFKTVGACSNCCFFITIDREIRGQFSFYFCVGGAHPSRIYRGNFSKQRHASAVDSYPNRHVQRVTKIFYHDYGLQRWTREMGILNYAGVRVSGYVGGVMLDSLDIARGRFQSKKYQETVFTRYVQNQGLRSIDRPVSWRDEQINTKCQASFERNAPTWMGRARVTSGPVDRKKEEFGR